MKIFAETERLILRELLPTDVEGMFELDSDPEVHKYLGNKPVTSREQVVDVINIIRQQYIDNGIGRWAVIDKKTNDFIGWSGLKWITTAINGRVHYLDLGYRLKRQYWRQGIATETIAPSLEYAFNTLHAKEVFAIADIGNAGSNKILQNAGMTFVETFDYDDALHNWYEIDKVKFESRF